jgi:nucleoside-diphosphate-sugar epimerase
MKKLPAIRFRFMPLPNSRPRKSRRVWPRSGNARSLAYGSALCSGPGRGATACATRQARRRKFWPLGGREAVLPRPGLRDWIFAPDVAEAVALLIEAERPKHQLYNISTGVEWSALQWGQELAALHSGFICRLKETGEAPTIDLHGPTDRAPLSVARLAQEFGWRARFGCADSAADLSMWWTHRGEI